MKNDTECPEIDLNLPDLPKPAKKTFGDYRPNLDGKPGDGYTVVSVVAML